MSNLEKLKQIFEELFGNEFNLDSVDEQSRFIEDLGMNSIGMLSMAMAIEQEFDIKFKNEDLVHLLTVGDALKCIEKA